MNSLFADNLARNGGGGIFVHVGKLHKSSPTSSIQFQNVTIIRNKAAEFGGGTGITALLSDHISKSGQLIEFINCTWLENQGYYAPAVEISPTIFGTSNQGYLPIPLFRNSIIMANTNYNTTHIAQGVFAITRFTEHFQGYQIFKQNNYSALCLTSGQIVFESNSDVIFQDNEGIRGGAILLLGSSAITANDNSKFLFINNHAAQVGGAICYISNDQKYYFAGRMCFLKYGGNKTVPNERNIIFNFTNNRAQLGGVSIYADSFYSCHFSYFLLPPGQLTAFFNFLWFFHFDQVVYSQSCNSSALATAARRVYFERHYSILAIPGETVSLPLAMYDEFQHPIASRFALRVEDNDNVYLGNDFTISNSSTVFGAPNQTTNVVLSTPQTIHSINYAVQVSFLPCPPGFFFDEYRNACSCSSDSDRYHYPAISKCNYSDYTVFIWHGYWAGYYPSDIHNADHLYTAPYLMQISWQYGDKKMPNSSERLSEFFCGATRKGILCGRCQHGYSAYYHTTVGKTTSVLLTSCFISFLKLCRLLYFLEL